MWADDLEDGDEASWLRKAGRVALGVALVGAVAAIIVTVMRQNAAPPPRETLSITRVLLPPPPPPPPPKPPEPQKVEQPKFQEPKPAPKAPELKPKPVQAPPHSPLTAEAGSGKNPYGLQVGNGSGDVVGGGNGGGSSQETWQLYAGLIQSQVQGALRRDDKTRFGSWRVGVKIWLNDSGAITRTELVSSSGDPSIDGAVTRSIDGLTIGQAPPQGMPQPVDLRISAVQG